jgi:hypothetical protein
MKPDWVGLGPPSKKIKRKNKLLELIMTNHIICQIYHLNDLIVNYADVLEINGSLG